MYLQESLQHFVMGLSGAAGVVDEYDQHQRDLVQSPSSSKALIYLIRVLCGACKDWNLAHKWKPHV